MTLAFHLTSFVSFNLRSLADVYHVKRRPPIEFAHKQVSLSVFLSLSFSLSHREVCLILRNELNFSPAFDDAGRGSRPQVSSAGAQVEDVKKKNMDLCCCCCCCCVFMAYCFAWLVGAARGGKLTVWRRRQSFKLFYCQLKWTQKLHLNVKLACIRYTASFVCSPAWPGLSVAANQMAPSGRVGRRESRPPLVVVAVCLSVRPAGPQTRNWRSLWTAIIMLDFLVPLSYFSSGRPLHNRSVNLGRRRNCKLVGPLHRWTANLKRAVGAPASILVWFGLAPSSSPSSSSSSSDANLADQSKQPK